MQHVPRAIERLAELLDDEDPRVVASAATALCDRGGVAPRAWEGERLEIVPAVDLDALRASLAARIASLAASRQPAELPPAAAATVEVPGAAPSAPGSGAEP